MSAVKIVVTEHGEIKIYRDGRPIKIMNCMADTIQVDDPVRGEDVVYSPKD